MLRGGCIRLGVNDIDAAVRFYVDVLGFQLAARFGDDWAVVDAGGGLLVGLAPRAAGEAPGGTVGLWTNEPFDAVLAALSEHGIELDGPAAVRDMVRVAFFRDPDGNRLSVANMPPSPTSAMGPTAAAAGGGQGRGHPHDQGDGQGGRLPFFEHLGLRWTEVGPTGVTVEIDVRDDLRGPAGTLQGGIIATLVDVAAASTAVQGGTGLVATSEMTIHFLAPGRVGPVRAVGELLRSRSGGAAVEVRVYDRGSSDRLMAVALGAFSELAGTRSTSPRPQG